VDGGYLENFGAATAQDLLTAISRTSWQKKVRPVIIQITNDPKLPEDWGKPNTGVHRDSSNGLFTELLGPLFGIINAYSGRARQAGSALANWARKDAPQLFINEEGFEPIYVHFRLFTNDQDRMSAPLGWVLSENARNGMDRQLWCNDHNRNELKKVVEALTMGMNLPESTFKDRCP
jgi:hypothetical protein